MSEAALHQSLRQQQTLSPNMRQSLEFLQASTMELSQLLRQSLEINPVLEAEAPDISLDELRQEEAIRQEEAEHLDETGADDDLRELSILQNAGSTYSADEAERREHLYNSIVSPQTLSSYLQQQLDASAIPQKMRKLAAILVGNLDERGFHDDDPHELCARLGISPELAKQGIALIQSLEPPGVGALDLRHSLLLQLERKGLGEGVEYRLVKEHLPLLARKQIPQLARLLHTSVERISVAAEVISRLDPAPGTSFDPTHNPEISADVRIYRTQEGRWQAELTNTNLPALRINDHYKALMGTTPDSKVRSYLREQIRSGRALLHAIDLRQETILAITQQIVERQTAFLEKGFSALRPMTMNELAETLELHATTISRAVGGKYAATPHGIIELRRFFTSAIHTESGTDVSNQSARDALQKLIASEDPAKPYSDDALQKLLAAQGLQLARRTVAKYREQLNILPSRLRKQYI